jgi:hypothetical protein
MISLRAQPDIVQLPQVRDQQWVFEFEVEAAGVYSVTGEVDNLTGLLNECAGIPMITNLNETSRLDPSLIISGSDQNLWFETINK